MQSTALRHLLPANFKSPCSACPGPQLEEGNAALLHEAAPLLDLLAADALSAHPAQATSALTALCTVLAADPTGGSADELYRTSLPARILSDLQEGPHRALTQPPPRGQALLLVAEAQLTLLLRLALAGPASQRSASAQKLFGLHALAKLSQCRAIDLQPEEPGFGQYSGECGAGMRRVAGSTSAAACCMPNLTADQPR
jgi:hypothetical protein